MSRRGFGLRYGAMRKPRHHRPWRGTIEHRSITDARGNVRCFGTKRAAIEAAHEAAKRAVYDRLHHAFHHIGIAVHVAKVIPPELRANLRALRFAPSWWMLQSALPGGEFNPDAMVAFDVCEAAGLSAIAAGPYLDAMWRADRARKAKP